MTERHLIRDRIRERELESGGVYGHVHSDQKFVTVTVDFPTFERMRRLVQGVSRDDFDTQRGRCFIPVHSLSPLDVTLVE